MGVERYPSSSDKKRILRRLELEAYASVVSAFRAQGALTTNKKSSLELLGKHFSITPGRHRAEVRRAVNDDLLASIAGCNSPVTDDERLWRKEGQKLASSNARFTSRPSTHVPQLLTAATIATSHSRADCETKSYDLAPKQQKSTFAKPLTSKDPIDRKIPSIRVQNVLKYIISQNPNGALAKSQQTVSSPVKQPRPVQSAPATPVKRSTTALDKTLLSALTTSSSQLTKVISPLKALVMSASPGVTVSQTSPKLTSETRKKEITGEVSGALECRELLETSPDKTKVANEPTETEIVKTEARDVKVNDFVEARSEDCQIDIPPVRVLEPTNSYAQEPETDSNAPLSSPDDPIEGDESGLPIEGNNTDDRMEGDDRGLPIEGNNMDDRMEGDDRGLPIEGDDIDTLIDTSIEGNDVDIDRDIPIQEAATTSPDSPQSDLHVEPSSPTQEKTQSNTASHNEQQESQGAVTKPSPSEAPVETILEVKPENVPEDSLESVSSRVPSPPAQVDHNLPTLSEQSPDNKQTNELDGSLQHIEDSKVKNIVVDNSVTPPVTAESLTEPLFSSRKRPALTDILTTPAKKQALTAPLSARGTHLSNVDVPTETTFIIQSSLAEVVSSPTVDTDTLLQSLCTDQYSLEESQLASELGLDSVDPSLLDLSEFMGFIQPGGTMTPQTPSTPVMIQTPLTVPGTPTTTILIPETPTDPMLIPGTPTTTILIPETPTDPMLIPGTPTTTILIAGTPMSPMETSITPMIIDLPKQSLADTLSLVHVAGTDSSQEGLPNTQATLLDVPTSAPVQTPITEVNLTQSTRPPVLGLGFLSSSQFITSSQIQTSLTTSPLLPDLVSTVTTPVESNYQPIMSPLVLKQNIATTPLSDLQIQTPTILHPFSLTAGPEVITTKQPSTLTQNPIELSSQTLLKDDTIQRTGINITPVVDTEEPEVVQLTSKDMDILQGLGLGGGGIGDIVGDVNEKELLEGIPLELAATIQAIARIDEQDSAPWKQ